jgi:hypothetical protein
MDALAKFRLRLNPRAAVIIPGVWFPTVPALLLIPTPRELRARFQQAEREQSRAE